MDLKKKCFMNKKRWVTDKFTNNKALKMFYSFFSNIENRIRNYKSNLIEIKQQKCVKTPIIN